MAVKLAIHGGPRTIEVGRIQPWPPIDDTDRQFVLKSLESHRPSFGPNCEALQEEFATWNGNRFAIATNSGTAALHMGVAACGCGAGDEVIVPAYSWSSSVTCVLHHNAIPIFVDIDWETMNLDVDRIEEAITPRTKAILVVHLHGLVAPMDKILAIAEKHGLKVIEDACQAHGARYKGKKAGTWGHCAAFSCNHNKLMCAGDGGLFVTDDPAIHAQAQMLWSFGETRTPVQDRDYHAYALGWMYRMNDLTAAFGRAQLAKLQSYLDQIQENVAVLQEGLKGVSHLILPTVPDYCQHNWYNYVLRFDMQSLGHEEHPRAFRDRIVRALGAEGIPTSAWQQFILPAMTVFQARNAYGRGCPWECRSSSQADYSPDLLPVSQKHCETHTCLVMALRPPNGTDIARLLAQGIRKVMENVAQLED